MTQPHEVHLFDWIKGEYDYDPDAVAIIDANAGPLR